MPENIQDVIVRYRADVSELQTKVAQIEASMRKAEGAGKGIGTALNAQVSAVDNLRNRLQQLTTARDQSNDPAKVARINEILRVQGTRLTELTTKQKLVGTQFTQSTTQATGFGERIKGITAGMAPLGDQIKSIGTNLVAAFAVERVIAFGVESIKAFQQAELNAIQLRNAVSVNGGLQEDFDRLIEQSAALQEITIFSDDDIQVAQKIALQYGLTASQVERLIPIIADFASATGQELQPALQAVLSGVNGNARALKQYGVVVDSTKSKTENLASIQDQLNKKFEGQAEVVGETSAGAFRILGNQIDDIKENIGGFLTDITDGAATLLSFALNGFRPLNEEIDATGRSLFKTREELERFQSTATAATIAALVFQIEKLQAADVDVTHLVNQLNTLKSAKVKLEVTGLSDTQLIERRKELEKIPILLQDQANELKIINAEIDKRNLDYILSQKDITKLTTEELEKRRKIIEEKNKEVNNQQLTEAIEAIDEELSRRTDAAKKIGDERVNQAKEASNKLAELENKTNDELIKGSNLTAAERLQIEKDRAFQELQTTFDASEKTLQDRENLNTALLNLEETFAKRERDIKNNAAINRSKNEEETIQQEIDQAKARFDLLKANIDSQKEIELARIDQEFIQAGDNSEQAVAQNEQDVANIERQFNDQRLTEEKQFVDQFLALQERLFQSKKKTAELQTNAVVQDLFSDVDVSTGLPTPAQSQAAAEKIGKIQRDLKNDQIKLGNEATNALIDGQNAVTDNAISNAEIQKRLDAESLRRAEEIATKRTELETSLRDAAIDAGESIINRIVEDRARRQLESIEELKDAELQAIDEELAANEEKREQGIIGDREAQRNKELLLQKRQQAEEQAAAKERAIKREQFVIDQLAAVAKVVFANIINAAEFPLLSGYYAGLALLQSAIIFAEPNPYKRGTKKSKAGLSLVGEEGPELMYMPEGNKILPAGKTKQHGEVIDAMYDNRLDDYIRQFYVQPEIKKIKQQSVYGDLNNILSKLQISHELKAAEQKFQINKQEQFAMNIANSIFMNKESLGLTRRDLREVTDEIRRKGTYMRNANEFTEPIVEALKPLRKPSYKR